MQLMLLENGDEGKEAWGQDGAGMGRYVADSFVRFRYSIGVVLDIQ